MSVTDPDVQRLINYGGYYRRSARGGEGEEFYGVYGLVAREFAAAVLLGLPDIGKAHRDPALSFVGTVQDHECVQELGPVNWIARVRYSTGGTFNFSTRIGSRSRVVAWEDVPMPVLGRSSANSAVYYSVTPKPTWKRPVWQVVESARYIGDVNAARERVSRNLGRFYEHRASNWVSQSLTRGSTAGGPVLYQLWDADFVTDAGNNTRIDTVFQIRGEVPEFRATDHVFGSVQAVDIPKLPGNCNYAEDVLNGRVLVVDPLAQMAEGEPLPWLT